MTDALAVPRARVFTRMLGGGTRHQPGGGWPIVIAIGSVLATCYVLWIGALATVVGAGILHIYDWLRSVGLDWQWIERLGAWARSYTANFHRDISIFIAITFPIAFLTTTAHADRKRLAWIDVLLAVLSFAVALYYIVLDNKFLNWSFGFSSPSTWDTIVGITLIVLVIELCRRCTGWGLTSLVLLLLFFAIFGNLLPGELKHDNFSMRYFIEMMTISPNGVFGSPLQVAATYAFLFVLFGNFFEKTGGGDLFFGLSSAVTGRMTGGAAKACVAASGLYGSVSGSPTADVATTGPLTIPVMKKMGISPARAAAIEATASSGGAMLPPVMGAVAFIMADLTGLTYASIALASLLPAILYYVAIFIAVHNEAVRNDEGRMDEDQIGKLSTTIINGWRHLLPLAALVSLLILGYTPVYIAAGSTAAVIILSWLSPRNAITPKRFVECCMQTIFQLVPLVGAVAAAGLIIGAVEISALAGKFTLLINYFSGGYLVPTLMLSSVFLILLGMGMPTPAVYLTAAALLAPVLRQHFNLPVMQVHLFFIYFSCLSAITPPVAVANFAAGAIAGANPMTVGRHAVVLAAGGFVLPFFFMFNPGLNMQGGAVAIVVAFVFALAMITFVSFALHGYMGKARIHPVLRLVLAACAAAVIAPHWTIQLPAAIVGGGI
ncbi:MAG: TRAP transporter fused permease subunit, partial [Variovorax sp.]